MDTMKILLGATVALLLGALAMSWNGLNHTTASPEDLASNKQEIELLKLDVERLKQEKQATELRTRYTPPPAPAASEADQADLKAQLAAKNAQLQQIEEEKNKAQQEAKVSDAEALEASRRNIEQHDMELRRARQISQSLVMGKVKEYMESPDVGDIVVIDVVMPENVQPGAILAIRKNTGILGQIKVTEVTADGAVGTPMPGFGPVKPQVGDELIVPPQL